MLLNRGAIKLVIIDSIAALFRVEYSFGETSKRAKVLRSFGAQLHKLSHQHGIPVVCVNQVCNFKLFSLVPGDSDPFALCHSRHAWCKKIAGS